MKSKIVKSIFLSIPVLAVAAILGVIALTGSSGPAHAEHLETFTRRAPMEGYIINQPPNFMIHSRATNDVVMQRSEFPVGPGAWHTHPGPSIVIVAEGRLKLTRFTKKDGCVDTEWFGPGEARQAFFEVGNEVHRATVEGPEPAVVHVTRFNIPVEGAITIPADDPGC